MTRQGDKAARGVRAGPACGALRARFRFGLTCVSPGDGIRPRWARLLQAPRRPRGAPERTRRASQDHIWAREWRGQGSWRVGFGGGGVWTGCGRGQSCGGTLSLPRGALSAQTAEEGDPFAPICHAASCMQPTSPQRRGKRAEVLAPPSGPSAARAQPTPAPPPACLPACQSTPPPEAIRSPFTCPPVPRTPHRTLRRGCTRRA